MLEATLLASVVQLVDAPVALPMMFVMPPTASWLTAEFWLPESVMVATAPPVFVTTGVKPAAPGGPTMVTVLPETVAL